MHASGRSTISIAVVVSPPQMHAPREMRLCGTECPAMPAVVDCAWSASN